MKWFVDDTQMFRMCELIKELRQDLQASVALENDRRFIERIHTMLNVSKDDRRHITVAEADRIGTLYAQYQAWKTKKEQ